MALSLAFSPAISAQQIIEIEDTRSDGLYFYFRSYEDVLEKLTTWSQPAEKFESEATELMSTKELLKVPLVEIQREEESTESKANYEPVEQALSNAKDNAGYKSAVITSIYKSSSHT